MLEEALAEYDRVLPLENDPSRTRGNKADCLGSLAQRLWDAGECDAARERFTEAFQCYQQAVNIKHDFHEAFNGWAASLIGLWRRDRSPGLLEEARAKCLEAERWRPGSAIYNLACVEALSGEAGKALEHLEAGIEALPRLAADARTDPDLESLQSHPRFLGLTGQAR